MLADKINQPTNQSVNQCFYFRNKHVTRR